MNMSHINIPELHYIQQSPAKSQVTVSQQSIDRNLSVNERLERLLKERKRKTGYVTEKLDVQRNTLRYIYLNGATGKHVRLLS